MEMKPLAAGERLTVDGYGSGTFKVAGTQVRGSMLIRGDRYDPWPARDVADVAEGEAIGALTGLAGEIDILLVGTGTRTVLLGPSTRKALREAGLGVEVMSTPAACRTYNVLVAEGRRVAAAVLAMPDDDG